MKEKMERRGDIMVLTESEIEKLTSDKELAERTLKINFNLTRAQKGKLLSIIRDAENKLGKAPEIKSGSLQVVEAEGPLCTVNVFSFLFPAIGLILYFVWKSSEPEKASGVGKAAFLGLCVLVRLAILFVLARLFWTSGIL